MENYGQYNLAVAGGPTLTLPVVGELIYKTRLQGRSYMIREDLLMPFGSLSPSAWAAPSFARTSGGLRPRLNADVRFAAQCLRTIRGLHPASLTQGATREMLSVSYSLHSSAASIEARTLFND